MTNLPIASTSGILNPASPSLQATVSTLTHHATTTILATKATISTLNGSSAFSTCSTCFAKLLSLPPPTPPPLPHVSRDRMLAWVGLFGSPAVLLTALVVGIHLPSLVGYLLVAGFIGGFLYLVVQMPSGPADPWDDGARL